jgi:hypothetical protein
MRFVQGLGKHHTAGRGPTHPGLAPMKKHSVPLSNILPHARSAPTLELETRWFDPADPTNGVRVGTVKATAELPVDVALIQRIAFENDGDEAFESFTTFYQVKSTKAVVGRCV